MAQQTLLGGDGVTGESGATHNTKANANFTELYAGMFEAQADADTANSNLSTHISDPVAAHPGSAISFSPGSSGLSATDVNAAIEELAGISGAGAASETVAGIAELATQSEITTGTDDSRIVTPLKLNTKLRTTRNVTGAGSIQQSDDNSLIIFNSATPFNFTLDQLTANTKTSFINIGAGAVTFVAGAGVTVSGSAILTASAGTAYPTAIVFYHTATTPRAITGGNGGQLIPMSIAIDTGPSPDELTLACAGAEDVVFSVTSAATANFTLIFSGHEFTQRITLLLNVNGTVAIACPSGTSGQPNIVGEEADLRYTSKTLTLTTTAEKSHIITFLRKTSGTTGVMMMTTSLPISVS